MFKWLKELGKNLEEEFRRLPVFSKVLVSAGAFLFIAGGVTTRFLLPYLEENYDITPYIELITGGAYACICFGLLIFAFCFKKPRYRIMLIFIFSVFLFSFLTEAPESWIHSFPIIFKKVLFVFAFLGPPLIGFLALRYYQEQKKGYEVPSLGEKAWGIKLSLRAKYIFELLNLTTAILYCVFPVAQFSVFFKDSMDKRLLGFIILILMYTIFFLGYYINTRYIFQGLLLPPWKMKKFLLTINIIFYSLSFLSVFLQLLLRVTLLSLSLWLALVLSIAVAGIFFTISYLGAYHVSLLAKEQLSLKWDNKKN